MFVDRLDRISSRLEIERVLFVLVEIDGENKIPFVLVKRETEKSLRLRKLFVFIDLFYLPSISYHVGIISIL